jgi:hypothetical protein
MPIVKDAGWAPQPVWKFWRRNEAVAPDGLYYVSDEQNPHVFKKRFGFVIRGAAAFFTSTRTVKILIFLCC